MKGGREVETMMGTGVQYPTTAILISPIFERDIAGQCNVELTLQVSVKKVEELFYFDLI